MKAAIFDRFGGPEVITYSDVPDPELRAGDVLVQIKAIGLNFADIYRRRGEYTIAGSSPYILGYEGAGVVEAVGDAVNDFRVGDRVAFGDVPRANAELVAAPFQKLVKLPKEITFEVAAGVLLQGMTAHFLSHDSHPIQAGEKVLIHAAAGGVGQLLVQMAKLRGAFVIGIVSTQEKASIASELGADHVIVASEYSFCQEVFKVTSGTGVDVAYDSIGSTLEESLKAVKRRGKVVFFGWAGGAPPKLDPTVLVNESKTIVGGDLWHHIENPEDLARRSSDLFGWIKDGRLKVNVAHRISLEDAIHAHQLLESRKTTGKIILIP